MIRTRDARPVTTFEPQSISHNVYTREFGKTI